MSRWWNPGHEKAAEIELMKSRIQNFQGSWPVVGRQKILWGIILQNDASRYRQQIKFFPYSPKSLLKTNRWPNSPRILDARLISLKNKPSDQNGNITTSSSAGIGTLSLLLNRSFTCFSPINTTRQSTPVMMAPTLEEVMCLNM